MCDLENGKLCNNYSSCPILLAVTQRSYMNRTLDAIFKTLNRIEKHLEEMNGKEK
jgi:hypothetical protein